MQPPWERESRRKICERGVAGNFILAQPPCSRCAAELACSARSCMTGTTTAGQEFHGFGIYGSKDCNHGCRWSLWLCQKHVEKRKIEWRCALANPALLCFRYCLPHSLDQPPCWRFFLLRLTAGSFQNCCKSQKSEWDALDQTLWYFVSILPALVIGLVPFLKISFERGTTSQAISSSSRCWQFQWLDWNLSALNLCSHCSPVKPQQS